MELKEKLETIKHIKLGTDEVLHYDYRGNPLPLRPISSYEMDQCFYNALENAEPKIATFVVQLRLKLIEDNRKINLSNDGYAKLLEFYNTVNYWIVYFAMKDFQPKFFSRPDYYEIEMNPKGFYLVKKMNNVHEIAEFVINSSYKSKKAIKEILKDEIGREVAYVVYYLNVPLADIKNLTKLQRDYLIFSKGKVNKFKEEDLKNQTYSVSDEVMTLKELREVFGH